MDYREWMRCALVPLLAAFAAPATATDWLAEVGLEGRLFAQEGPWGQADKNLSLRLQPEYTKDWNNRDDSFNFQGFLRVDQHDNQRTHADVRAFSWTHVGDGWELLAGVDKVFWGVTESEHLVDVINQTDLVEDIDGEDKLGQPMLRLSFLRDWGTVEVFALPYFRERTFPGEDGRFRTPLPIDRVRTDYESGARQQHFDSAIRYRRSFSGADISLAHFSGTNRDPQLRFNGDFSDPKLVPYYSLIEQTSLSLQYVVEGWLWKLEALTRSGDGDRYGAAVGGFEYTQVGIFDSDMDLGWVGEYLWDERGDAAPTFTEHDVFLGWRFTLNDVDSTDALLGVIWDPGTQERLYSLEASRRVAEDYKLSLVTRVIAGGKPVATSGAEQLNALSQPDADNKLGYFRSEDYVQLELTRYF